LTDVKSYLTGEISELIRIHPERIIAFGLAESAS
jgi:hypothetical protein